MFEAEPPSRFFVPNGPEKTVQLIGGGALEAHMHVVPVRASLRKGGVIIADVGASGEGDFAIDDKNFTMVASGPGPARPPRSDRVIFEELHPGIAQAVKKHGVDIQGADGV